MPETRVHPCMPTFEEVKQDPTCYFSDHVPCLFKQDIAGRELKIVAWNVLGLNALSGGHNQQNWEDDEHAQSARLARIAEALQTFADFHRPEIIVLQEANSKLLPLFEKGINMLGQWSVYDSGRGVMMLVNRTQCVLLTQSKHIHHINEQYAGVFMQSRQVVEVQFAGQKLKIHNVHTAFRDTPEFHEGYYQALMADSPQDVVIIVGDTNSRIVPEDTTLQVVTTGVIPMLFNDKVNPLHASRPYMQLTDFPDGAFIRKPGKAIQTIPRLVLDPVSGRVMPAIPAKQAHYDELRMLLSFDELPNDLALLQDRLLDLFKDPQALVRPAAKDNNERGVGIRFHPKSAVFRFLYQALSNKLGINPTWWNTHRYPDRDDIPCPVLFIHTDRWQILLDLLEPAFTTLLEIRLEIQRLQQSSGHVLLHSPENKILALSLLGEKIRTELDSDTLEMLIDQWLNESIATSEGNRSVKSIMADPRNIFSIFSRMQTTKSQTWVDHLTQAAKSDSGKDEPPKSSGNSCASK